MKADPSSTSGRNSKRMSRRLLLLIVVLVGLLAWKWATDHSSPAHPGGAFGADVAAVVMLVGLTAGVVVAWRAIRNCLRRWLG